MGPQGRSVTGGKISSTPGFDPRTVQPGSSVSILTELQGPLIHLLVHHRNSPPKALLHVTYPFLDTEVFCIRSC